MWTPRARLTGLTLVAAALLVAADASAQDRWFGRDKALHFAAGTALGAGGYALASAVSDRRGPRIAIGLSVGIGAGTAKELRDRRGGGTASWRDLVWTAGGAATGVTAAWLVDRRSDQTSPASASLAPFPPVAARW